jgi:hypothetical protein
MLLVSAVVMAVALLKATGSSGLGVSTSFDTLQALKKAVSNTKANGVI